MTETLVREKKIVNHKTSITDSKLVYSSSSDLTHSQYHFLLTFGIAVLDEDS